MINDDDYLIAKEEAERDIENIFQQYGENLVRTGEPVWELQADALEGRAMKVCLRGAGGQREVEQFGHW